MIGKRKKDIIAFQTGIALTNMAVLLNKKICTKDQWEAMSGKIVSTMERVESYKGTHKDIMEELSQIDFDD